MSVPFPRPTEPASSRTDVHLRYLAYFRDGVGRRVEAMSEDEVRRSRVPSGWTPLELVRHLAPRATLERVLLHVVQEHARHLGQLDIVAELAGGVTDEV